MIGLPLVQHVCTIAVASDRVAACAALDRYSNLLPGSWLPGLHAEPCPFHSLAPAPSLLFLKRILRPLRPTPNPHRIADSLLQHMYRWVSSPSSPLHHPGLHRHLLALQHKLFLQLCAEMRRLGAVLVAANTHSVTLCTGKRSVRAAAG